MKKECKNCAEFATFNKFCKKGLQNPVQKCHKYKTVPVEDLKKERNKLLISKDNPERLKELEERIMYFQNGVI